MFDPTYSFTEWPEKLVISSKLSILPKIYRNLSSFTFNPKGSLHFKKKKIHEIFHALICPPPPHKKKQTPSM